MLGLSDLDSDYIQNLWRFVRERLSGSATTRREADTYIVDDESRRHDLRGGYKTRLDHERARVMAEVIR